jgi:hypothetical protein
MPVICAAPLEKLLGMQGRAKLRCESWIVARQFHSSLKFFRRSRAILSPMAGHPAYYVPANNRLRKNTERELFDDTGEARWRGGIRSPARTIVPIRERTLGRQQAHTLST